MLGDDIENYDNENKTLFADWFCLKRGNFFWNKEKVKASSCFSHRTKRKTSIHSAIIPKRSEEEVKGQFNRTMHKSSLFYLNRNNKEAPMTAIPKKTLNESETDIKLLKTPFNIADSHINDISQSSAHEKSYDSNQNNKGLIYKNPFDSFYVNNDEDKSNYHHPYSRFNTSANNKANYHNKKCSTSNLIYEAPQSSNDLLNQLKLFNPKEAQNNNAESHPNKAAEEELKNKKLISAFNINSNDSNSEPILINSEIEDINHKSFDSFDMNACTNLNCGEIGTSHSLNCNSSHSFHKKQFTTLHNEEEESKDETHLHHAIPLNQICSSIHSYSSMPVTENKYQISKRLMALINNNELSSLIIINASSFSTLTAPLPLSQSEEELIIEKLNKEFYDNNQNLTLFESITSTLHRTVTHEDNSPIGIIKPIEDIKSYLIGNDQAINSQIKEVLKQIGHFRQALCDGDGFFRVFAYGLFEYLIKNNKQPQLKRILFEMTAKSKEVFKYNNIHIKKETVLIITKIIMTHIENNQLLEAHQVFTHAFLREKDFELSIIKYIKIAVADFIKANFIRISKENQLLLFPKKYFSKGYNCLDVISYIDEAILRMNYEPNICVYYFAPIVFGVNLQLIAFEKENVFTHVFACDYSNRISSMETKAQRQKEMITLMYSCSRFYLGYKRNKLQRLNRSGYNSIEIHYNRPIRRYRVVERNSYCRQCQKQSDEAVINRFASEPFCKNCLKNKLNEVIGLLSQLFIQDNYCHLECKELPIYEFFRLLPANYIVKGQLKRNE